MEEKIKIIKSELSNNLTFYIVIIIFVLLQILADFCAMYASEGSKFINYVTNKTVLGV